MTEQDGDTEESSGKPEGTPATDSDDDPPEADTAVADPSAEGDKTVDDSAVDALSDIASEPAGDVDEMLSRIVGESDADGDGDEPADRDGAHEGPDPDPALAEQDLVDDVDPTLVDELAGAPPETTARIVATLERDRERLARELAEARDRAEDFESRLKRKQADFQNYKKRQQERLEEEKQRATEDLVARLLDVRDNLERALDQDEGADIRGGVETTLDQFDEQLARENVEQIRPETGEETDPQRHEVLATVGSDQPEGTVADVHRTGYEMGGKVLRPAQVVVSDGENDEA